VFGLSPYFLLPKMSDVPQYLAQCRWGSLDPVAGVTFRNRQAFSFYRRTLAQVPVLEKLFVAAFQKGYAQPALRLSAYQWLQALKAELGGMTKAKVKVVPIRAMIPRTPPMPAAAQDPGAVVNARRNSPRSYAYRPRRRHPLVRRLQWAFDDLKALLHKRLPRRRPVLWAGLVLSVMLLFGLIASGRFLEHSYSAPTGLLTANRAALLNVRAEPRLGSKVKSIIEVHPGDRLALIEAKGRWSRVQVNLGDKSAVGWVYDAGEVSTQVEVQSADSR
jgi:hypothetical protein